MSIRSMFGFGAVVVACLSVAPESGAGVPVCGPFTTDMVSGYLAGGDPSLRSVQDTDSGWTYHQGSPGGPLLSGIAPGAINVTAGYWGSPALAFTIPTAGPVFSDDPQINQINFGYRTPSFTGLFLHPGEGDGLEGCASLNIQAPIVVTAISGKFEKLGTWDGALCRVVKRVGGVDTNVVPPTFVAPYPSTAVDLIAASGSFPLFLAPGDKLWVQTQRFGNANEDWCSANISLTFTGGPLIPAPATVTPACFGRSAKLKVQALGSSLTYQWRRNGTNITNTPNRFAGATTSELTVSALTKPDTADVYDCVVTSSCSGFAVVSGAGRVTNLLPDLNSDGFINTADLTGFLGRFGQTVSPLDPADINSDGVVNVQDLTAFLGAFGRPCPGV